MATRLTPEKSEGENPTAKKAPEKKAVMNGPASSAKARPTPRARKRLPAATAGAPTEPQVGEMSHNADSAASCTRSHIPNARTRKALRDADAGENLTTYVDADDLFKKLGIKLGEEKA